jgi:hypothetical protein
MEFLHLTNKDLNTETKQNQTNNNAKELTYAS